MSHSPACCSLGSALALLAIGCSAQASTLPPKLAFDNGVQLSLTTNLNWDVNRISDAAPGTSDDDGWRRREIGLLARKEGVFDVAVIYDIHNENWLDAALRVESKALFGVDVGKIRVGSMKLHAGLEGVAANRQMAFMENAAATQVFYPMARAGVTWSLVRPDYLVDAGIYGRDFDGNSPGGTQLLRAAWTPTSTAGAKAHLGLALTRDTPSGTTNALGQYQPGGKRWSSRSTASLSTDRLLDTGLITDVSEIQRQNLQAMWMQGPWWAQGEYFFQQTERHGAQGDYRADGGYASAGWVFNATPRQLSQGMLSNPKVGKGQIGTEVVARYGHVNLDSDGIDGGKLTEWTVGANWYLGPYVKLQLNYTQARARRMDHGPGPLRPADFVQAPRTLQLRTQFYF